jgi:hypothetical protein
VSSSDLGQFVIEFAKSLLRTNYYTAEHQVARTSVAALYQIWRTAVPEGDFQLSALHKQETHGILITGPSVSDMPLNKVVGQATAELFQSKLLDFMGRADLIAFTLGRGIDEAEFLTFLELMARPHDPTQEAVNRLDRALWDRGIRHITVLFRKDLLGAARKLSWAAALALSRLGKDLGRLPIFKDLSSAEITEVRAQILADVLRPASNPALMSEILLNLDIVSTQEEKPLSIAEVAPLLPAGLRLATALRLELSLTRTPTPQLREVLATLCFASVEEAPPAAAIDLAERLIGRRVVMEEQLPAPLRRTIEIRRLTEAWIENLDQRVATLSHGSSQSAEEATLVISELLRRQRYPEAAKVGFALSQGAPVAHSALSAALTELVIADLAESYRATPLGDRQRKAALLSLLSRGEGTGAELNALIEADAAENPQSLRGVLSLLPAGELQIVVLKALQAETMGENAATFLLPFAAKVGARVVDSVSRLISHPSVRIRSLAVSTLASFGRKAAEKALAAALSDGHPEVCSAAVSALATVCSRRIDVLEAYRHKLLDRNTAPAVRIAAAEALGTLGGVRFVGGATAETLLIDCLKQIPGGLRGRLLPLARQDEALYVAACRSLEKVGSRDCLPMLENAGRCGSRAVKDAAATAMERVRTRGATVSHPSIPS